MYTKLNAAIEAASDSVAVYILTSELIKRAVNLTGCSDETANPPGEASPQRLSKPDKTNGSSFTALQPGGGKQREPRSSNKQNALRITKVASARRA